MGTEKIAIRLRDHRGNFLSRHAIISSLIHELAHMDVSDHGPKFREKEKELRALYQNKTQESIDDDISTCIGKNMVWICMILCLLLGLMRQNKHHVDLKWL